jgi:hypothetical protein
MTVKVRHVWQNSKRLRQTGLPQDAVRGVAAGDADHHRNASLGNRAVQQSLSHDLASCAYRQLRHAKK